MRDLTRDDPGVADLRFLGMCTCGRCCVWCHPLSLGSGAGFGGTNWGVVFYSAPKKDTTHLQLSTRHASVVRWLLGRGLRAHLLPLASCLLKMPASTGIGVHVLSPCVDVRTQYDPSCQQNSFICSISLVPSWDVCRFERDDLTHKRCGDCCSMHTSMNNVHFGSNVVGIGLSLGGARHGGMRVMGCVNVSIRWTLHCTVLLYSCWCFSGTLPCEGFVFQDHI